MTAGGLRMKILLATYWEIPHLGGVWPLMERLAHDLRARGHEVDIFGNNVHYYHLVNQQRRFIKSHYSPLIETHLNHTPLSANAVVYHTEVDRLIMELTASTLNLGQYDLIHTHDAISARSIARVKPPHVPLLVNPHGSLLGEIKLLIDSHALPSSNYDLLYTYYSSLEKRGILSANHALAASNWLKQVLGQDYRVPDTHVSVFPYGIDTARFHAQMHVPNEAVVPPYKKVITYAGRFVHLKGIQVLLKALSALKQIRQDWVCWLIGEGDNKSEYIQQAESLGLGSDVVFWGARSDVPRFMALTDIYVQPSLQDNQPLSVIEAQVAGCAVVVSSASGLPEMIQHGSTGVVVPVNDSDSLFRHLHHLLQYDTQRIQMGQHAQHVGMHHWSLARYNQDMFHLYQRVTGKPV
ncbi:glycosyltransferase family 4 protein [Paenibacillus agilis]|uniref:Glycosyltransferase family 4 protein n=2 Tax=Paenibacillus agilis TaxID=3020863 RepID=A0A559IHN6_9BACL|nr:glycosyltransferase family 4 protein [Paenibacillus agilis]